METMVDTDVPARMRAVVGKLSRRLTASARGSGLTQSQLSALGVIARQGPLRVSELAEIESVNPTMLSRVVSALEDEQLIRRRNHPDDGRVALIEVTATGRRKHDKLRQQRGKVLADALATLTPDQVEAIEAAMPALEALTRAAVSSK